MGTAVSNISIEKVSVSKISEVDFSNIQFGRSFSDHMLEINYKDGAWQAPTIKPYANLSLAPSLATLHYGQSIFEGLKAHKGPNGEAILYRAIDNARRMNTSAVRMCMPEIPEDLFMEGLKALIDLDRNWIPPVENGSLYIRPLLFAADEYIGVKASDQYKFLIFTCPVGAYYDRPVKLLVTKDYIRAAKGGTGAAKTAGNYAASLYPDKIAKSKGYDNMLWLDAKEHEYIEECGTMNVFFVIDGTVITSPLTGTILPGINRDSALKILRKYDYKVEERPISITEVAEAYAAGKLEEAFGVGTAATVSHISVIGYNEQDMVLSAVEDRKVGNYLGTVLNDIKVGKSDDFGWTIRV